jgi:hypothetical protein
MSETARVTSIEAVRDFRNFLIMFCDEAKDALALVDGEIRRTEQWIDGQAAYWKKMIRDCEDEVHQAKAAIFKKKLGMITGEHPDLIEEKKALARAEQRVQIAHEKLENCQRWKREFPRAVGEYLGPARQLSVQVEGELPPAAVQLEKILSSLDAYTAVAPRSMAPPPREAAPAKTAPAASGFATRAVEPVSEQETPAPAETGEEKEEEAKGKSAAKS